MFTADFEVWNQNREEKNEANWNNWENKEHYNPVLHQKYPRFT